MKPHTPESWDKLRGEIEKVLWKHYDPDGGTMNAEEIMDDIMPLLAAERSTLREKIEGMRKGTEIGCKCNDFECLEKCSFSYNQALSDVLSLLKED